MGQKALPALLLLLTLLSNLWHEPRLFNDKGLTVTQSQEISLCLWAQVLPAQFEARAGGGSTPIPPFGPVQLLLVPLGTADYLECKDLEDRYS
jgi:hypothetical protein